METLFIIIILAACGGTLRILNARRVGNPHVVALMQWAMLFMTPVAAMPAAIKELSLSWWWFFVAYLVALTLLGLIVLIRRGLTPAERRPLYAALTAFYTFFAVEGILILSVLQEAQVL